MSASKSWLRRLDKLEAGLPPQPAESPYHLRAFEALGELQGLAARQPDFTGLLRAYRGLRPPYGTEKAGRLHDHLLGLSGRAEAGGPPRSAAAFAGLAAWLAGYGPCLPTVNGWKQDRDLGDGTTATLSGLTWRVAPFRRAGNPYKGESGPDRARGRWGSGSSRGGGWRGGRSGGRRGGGGGAGATSTRWRVARRWFRWPPSGS